MTASPLATSLRSHPCGALRAEHVGETVRLGGWVHRTRDLGGLVFVDLRDRAGLVQVSFAPGTAGAEVCARAASLGAETVVLIEGAVSERPAAMRNAEMATGDVEVERHLAERSSDPAATPAIPVARGRPSNFPPRNCGSGTGTWISGATSSRSNLVLRHRLLQRTRRFLSEAGFLEIETPILTKPTPEGARDYLVPSRVHPGEFYALPQSPADLQAAADGGRLRPVLPDRALFPRRGPARRPPAGVHADRCRGVIRDAGRRRSPWPRR